MTRQEARTRLEITPTSPPTEQRWILQGQRTHPEVSELGNDLIGRLEEAAAFDPVERWRRLTVVVVGGGFSGSGANG